MKRHPESPYPVEGTAEFDKNEAATKDASRPHTLYDGPVSTLASPPICRTELRSHAVWIVRDGTRNDMF